ncbi:hypothetical protein [Nesterenkonia populi]|uniref:hypothetical protein n=1 Tax=Nesterenkonia populi TaxID=1591087 RepID=UPI00147854B3|nr:hypothetical protein [Nesterenkonia populi]
MAGPVTVTISEVTRGNAEQPVNVHLHEFPGRPFKPSKSMRRVMAQAWGTDGEQYTNRILTLYRDPTVKFAGEAIGGIRISEISHIDKPLKVALTVTRGKRQMVTVKPISTKPQEQTISAEAWGDLQKIAADQEVENLPAWISEQLGRPLQGWQEITTTEAARLRQLMTTGEVKAA